MLSKESIAVVGCGYWGKNLVRNMHSLGALRCIVESHPAARANAQQVAPGVTVLPDLAAALADPGVKGVMIATPAETHFDVARQAIEAGRDVFVEKPLTVNVAQAVQLVNIANAANKILMVGHLLEYHPAIVKLHQLIKAGELGRIHYVMSNRVNLGKIRTEENALWSFAPHDIAVILRLVGKMPFEVVATGGCYVQPNIADVTVTQLLFDNGVRAHIFVSWLHPYKEQKLAVIGSKKMASYDDISRELILHDQHVDWKAGQPIPVKGEGIKVEFPADEPLKLECQSFLDAIQTRRQPLTDGESGVRVLRILEGAQRSLVTNGNPVQFSL
jgi:predicted dehydrogenase